jgi:16S rRNA (guanine527-N7)-methyltransferase
MDDDRARVLRLLNVSRETSEALDAYVDLLSKWQRRINLVSNRTVPEVWARHILDCGQLAQIAPEAKNWLDLGSGAGLPGIIVALILKDRGARVSLIEANQKKCAFLTEAARATGAPVTVFNGRIEQVLKSRFRSPCDIVTSRALANLSKLLPLVAPLLERGAQALFLKGQEAEAELTKASLSWRIEADLLPSVTDPNARIIRITSLSPRA